MADRGVRKVGEVDVRVPDALLLLAELPTGSTCTRDAVISVSIDGVKAAGCQSEFAN